jgi:hypothetical protein
MSVLRPHSLASLFALLGGVVNAEISFNHQIRPIISDNCFKCHGPDAKNQESEFRLDNAEHAYADLGGYFGIVPGDPTKSELVNRLHSTDPEELMPPADSNLSLSDEEKSLLEQWIQEGAKFEKHWSLQKLPATVEVPVESSPWAATEIDRYIERGFAEREVSPANPAPREKWLRRVTFDLTGLPPTLDEIEAFLADDSGNAHETVVDRLLDTTAYAERMTTEWLDVARYSDSFGYQLDGLRHVWPWRDWVIEAFDENMPYNEFVTLQIAGDLLPAAGPDEILPTAFNRLHGHVMEGGIVLEEYRVEYVADRVHTFGTAFLGLTMECARCHDHKYDPLPAKDYYSLMSFFANIDESGLISYFTEKTPTPALALSTSEADEVFAAAIADQLKAENALVDLQAEADQSEAFNDWLAFHRPDMHWPGLVGHLTFDELVELESPESHDPKDKKEPGEFSRSLANLTQPDLPALSNKLNTLVPGKFGQAMKFEGDARFYVPEVGHFEREDTFSFSIWLKPDHIAPRENVFSRGAGADDAASMGYEFLLIDGKPTASLIHFWPGNALRIQAVDPLTPQEWHHVTMTYDGSSKATGLKLYLNGEPMKTRVVKDHLTNSITDWIKVPNPSPRRHIVMGHRYRDRGFVNGQVDEFKVFDRELTPVEARELFGGDALAQLLAKDYAALTKEDRSALLDYFLLTASAEADALREELRVARATWNHQADELPAISVMRELPEPKPVYILERGAYDAHGEPVTADTPSALPPFPEDQPRNRLGLAKWMFQPDHPLTARVAVNRYWQLMFGQGIVRTPEDFGSQGQSPTHPELLDWLSRDFVNNGWDVKRLLRQMALSATYRQSTVISLATREKDPENVTFCRSEPKRLQAEMIRDNALAVSELLVNEIGGPPTHPYELEVGFNPVEPDEGDGVYRRSIYTLSKRNSPAPVMVAFDAPKRDVCTVKRAEVASPLQPLITLNGPQFVEASRVLAQILLNRIDGGPTNLIDEAFYRLTSRKPDADEIALMTRLYDVQLAEFSRNPEEAVALLDIGHAPVPDHLAPPQLAAATIVVNALMNLHESITHR